MSTTTTITRKRKAPAPPRRAPKRRKITRQTTRARNNRSRPAPSMSRALALHPDAARYIQTLSDPFTKGPVKLGFGCMTTSSLSTLTIRASFAAGSDGTAVGFVIPSIGSTGGTAAGLYFSAATIGTPLAVAVNLMQHDWFNKTAVSTLLEEARVVSCGLRFTPMIPGTASPGAAYVASLPTTSLNTINGQSAATLTYSPLFKWGSAASGAYACSRPIDPNSFIFHHDNVTGLAAGQDAPVTVPIVIMSGLPAGCVIQVEAVLHVEGIITVTSQSASLNQVTSSPASGLVRAYHSVENLWSTVSRYLPSSTTVRTAANLANALLAPDLYRGQRGRQSYQQPLITEVD